MKTLKPLLGLLGFVSLVVLLALPPSCSLFTPKTALTAADLLCRTFFSEKLKVSLEDAARTACATEEQLKPFLDEVIQAKARLKTKLAPAASSSASAAPSSSVAP